MQKGEPARHKVIARKIAYHGVNLGALAISGVDSYKAPFGPPALEVRHVSNTNRYRQPEGDDDAAFCARLLAEIEAVIIEEGPETIAMLTAEPIQNAGGCFTPPAGYWPGLRALADRYGFLLHADEVISGFGRLGEYFGVTRYDGAPDVITLAKGLTSGHVPDGRRDALRGDRQRAARAGLHADARPHLRRSPGLRGRRAEVPRDLRARGRPRGRPAQDARTSRS